MYFRRIRAAPKNRMSRAGIIVAILAFLVIAFVGYMAIRLSTAVREPWPSEACVKMEVSG